MLTSLLQRWKKFVLLERSPESGEVFLGQRRVFTVPSKAGLMFVLLLILLFVTATNYNLSLGFVLTFTLAAVAIINALFGFRNLAYLHLRAGPVQAVFAGEECRYPLYLINRRAHARYALWVGFAESWGSAHAIDIAAHAETDLELSYPTTTRGWQAIPRIRISTWFPLGLLRAWSSWLPDAQALVYPQPETNAPPLPLSGTQTQGADGQNGQEEFAGVRSYQPGDALKHLAWKQIARVDIALGGQLVSKQFSSGSGSDLVLDFHALPAHMDTELKLSRLTSWVLEAEQRGLPYAFRLGQWHVPAAHGPAQRAACLRALALFQRQTPDAQAPAPDASK